MFRRRESVPFAFVADSERFRSNVTPPPKQRVSRSEALGRSLVGLLVVAGLAGSLLFGVPALSADQTPAHAQQSEASQGH